ncbi:ribosome small subunit-dependent GTPase A [bacterium]|nr:ribosome small subunit-dependent GTPase A [bacterium]
MKGQIFKIFSDLFYVKDIDGNIFQCKIREILKKQKTSVVTGDFVEFENDVISNILPRKSFIRRPAVANVDQIVIVSALKQPELDFNQLDRYIALAKYYNIPIVLCFNKEDLGLDNEMQDKIVSIYEDIGYKPIFTSALEKNGIKGLYNILKGKTSALCGNSGVGKSSLVNALNPDVHLKTKSVSDKINRGTHTTRHCEIVPLDNETGIIDTPGFSNVKFDFILPAEVDTLFDDISKYNKNCKYSDCLHINETGCGVLANIENIPQSRYESYLSFVKEAFEFKEKVKYNGVKTETHQKLHNNKSIAKISEKKRQSGRNTLKQKIYKELENNENE